MAIYEKLILRGWWVILIVLAIGAVWLGPHVPDLEVHTETEVFLGETDPALAYYEGTRPAWGYDEYAIVCATRDGWIDPDGVRLLEALRDDLASIPYVERVVSILDVPLLRQEPGPRIDITDIPTLTSEGVDLEAAGSELREHTQAQGNLMSEDGRSVNLLVYLDMPEEKEQLDPVVSALRARGAGDQR